MNTRWSAHTGKDIQAITSEDAIKAAGLNWRVLQSPVNYLASGFPKTAHGHVVNYREDTGNMLGIATSSYKVLQNSQAFKFLDGVVGSQEAMYTNAGSFKGGAKVYIQAKLPGYIEFSGDDMGEKLLTFITSHDGSLAVSVMFTPVRIVCQNTLNMALRTNERKTSVKHTLTMMDGLKEARETLGVMNAQFSLLESLSQGMTRQSFSDQDIPQLVEKSGLVPANAEKSTRAQNIIDEVLHSFRYGQGSNLKSARGTAWGAYNAVVEYVDHYRAGNAEKRAESSILGSGANVKQAAFDLLAR